MCRSRNRDNFFPIRKDKELLTGRCSVNWNYSPCLKARFVHLSASRFQASYIVGRLPCGAILSLPQRGRSHLLFLIMDDVVLQGICVGPGWAVAQRLNFCAQEPIRDPT